MRVAVADTGPLHYLVLIGAADLLPMLFEEVIAPTAVEAELLHPEAPAAVRAWMRATPVWLHVRQAPGIDDPALLALDDGERAVIELASAQHADIVLMDDRAGVAAARARGLRVTGTLGVLDRAAQRGVIDLVAAFAALRGTNFHVRQQLLEDLLARHRTRTAGR